MALGISDDRAETLAVGARPWVLVGKLLGVASTTIVVGSQLSESDFVNVVVGEIIVTPLAVSLVTEDVGGGGGRVTVSRIVELVVALVPLPEIVMPVGISVGPVVGGVVMSKVVLGRVVVSGGREVGCVTVSLLLLGGRVVGSTEVGGRVVVGPSEVGGRVVVGSRVVGSRVVGSRVVGGRVVGFRVVGSRVVGTKLVGSVPFCELVGSVTGVVVSTTVEPPVPVGMRVKDTLIPRSVDVGAGGDVVGSPVAVDCSEVALVSETETGGSVEVGAGGEVSVTFCVGRTILVTSETMLLISELMGSRGLLAVGDGSLVVVTMPVGASSIPVELVLTVRGWSTEETSSDDVGTVDGLGVSVEAIPERLLEAVEFETTEPTGESVAVPVDEVGSVVGATVVGTTMLEVVGRMMVGGTPPVDPTPLRASLALPLVVEFVIMPPMIELVVTVSVGGETTIVLAMMMVVTSGCVSELGLIESVLPTESLDSADMLESTPADTLELTNVGRSVMLDNRSLNEDSLFVVSAMAPTVVDCETGDSVVIVMFMYWRFT